MTATDADPIKVQTALWGMIDSLGVSANIFVVNRPDASKLDDFVVVDVNGAITDYDGYARCVCLVQLFAKDIDKKGTENMTKLTEMYEALLDGLPYVTGVYTFKKRNQVGRRDTLGFHATLINLDCLIS